MAYQTVNWQNVKVLLLLSVGDELWGGGLVTEKAQAFDGCVNQNDVWMQVLLVFFMIDVWIAVYRLSI